MSDAVKDEVLKKQIVYDGEGYTRDGLGDLIKSYQHKDQANLQKFEQISKDYERLAKEMGADILSQKTMWECLYNIFTFRSVLNNVKSLFSRMPLVNLLLPKRYVSELLEEKLEIAERRVHSIGNYLDQLQQDIKNLQDDIKRLNAKTVNAAQNEEKAAKYILELKTLLEALQSKLKSFSSQDSAEALKLKSEIDEIKHAIWEHGAKLRLFHEAADRISNITRMNNNFLELMQNLNGNLHSLYEAGTEVLDEIQGNLSGLASISRVSELTAEMHKSMMSLKDSMNKVAKLASETSVYLSQNVTKLTQEMKIYDEATVKLVESNLAHEREVKENRINETLELAQKKHNLGGGEKG